MISPYNKGQNSRQLSSTIILLFLVAQICSVPCDIYASIGCVDCALDDNSQCLTCNTALHYVRDVNTYLCLADTPNYYLDYQGISVSVCPVGTPDTATNLVVNGDFTSGGASWGGDPQIEVVAGVMYNVNWGVGNVLQLDGTINYGISQTIAGLTEGYYYLTMEYAPRASTTYQTNSMKILWNNIQIWKKTASDDQVHTYTQFVWANTGNNELQVKGTGTSDGIGMSIDNIGLYQVDPYLNLEEVDGQCKCMAGFSYDIRTNQCVCSRGSIHSSPTTCVPCDLGCIDCTIADGCLTCDRPNGFLLVPGPPPQCVCDTGYTLIDPTDALALLGVTVPQDFCVPCANIIPNCLTCSDTTTCTSCGSYYTVVSGGCADICGDGYPVDDQCDDGNLVDGDGCSSSCLIEVITVDHTIIEEQPQESSSNDVYTIFIIVLLVVAGVLALCSCCYLALCYHASKNTQGGKDSKTIKNKSSQDERKKIKQSQENANRPTHELTDHISLVIEEDGRQNQNQQNAKDRRKQNRVERKKKQMQKIQFI